MMIAWTRSEIESILIQLDNKKLPLNGYCFAKEEQRLKLLGTGGYAYVFQGESRGRRKKEYAIKVIGFKDRYVDSEFFRESVKAQKKLGEYQKDVVKVEDYAELLVWIDHENVVTKAEILGAYQQVENDDNMIRLQFVVMEKVEPVLSRDKAGKYHLYPVELELLLEDEILKLAHDIGTAINRAHDQNILHRDIKLENIFYSEKDKTYKLGDFGIAKKTEDGIAKTAAFTKGYGAPEVVGRLENEYDNTADIYSLGMVLYVLFNELRFPGSENYNVNLSHQYMQGYVLPEIEDCDEDISMIIERMCKYNPDDRYQSMKEVLADIEGVMIHENLTYKRKHESTPFIMGTLFCLIGIVVWRLTMNSDAIVGDTRWGCLFWGAGGIRALLAVLERRSSVVNGLMFLSVIVMGMQGSMTWWKVIILLLMLVVRWEKPLGLLSVSVLLWKLTNVVLCYMGNIYLGKEYSWIAITCLLCALLLFSDYKLLTCEDTALKQRRYQSRLYRNENIICSLLVFFSGCLLELSKSNPYFDDVVLEYTFLPFILECDLAKVGGFCFLFFLIFNIREYGLMVFDEFKKM